MKHPAISLCMIVKNEAPCLTDALSSVSGLITDAVVVDTGSEDETPAIARQMGARVYRFSWCDDFAAARNHGLAQASGDWILVLDADEILAPADHDRVRGLVRDGKADAFRLVQRTYEYRSTAAQWIPLDRPTPLARGAAGYLPSPLVRLFRNRPDFRFRGRVHELVEPSVLESGSRIVDTDIPIHHYGKMRGDGKTRSKQAQYQRIGAARVNDDPRDDRALCDLGIQRIELSRYAEAETVLRLACNLNPENIQARFNLAVSVAGQERLEESARLYEAVLAASPAHTGALNNLGQIFTRTGRTQEAADLYARAIKTAPPHHVTHYNYALALESLGKTGEAQTQYKAALAIAPEFDAARQRLDMLRGAAGATDPGAAETLDDMVAALDRLTTAVGAHPDDPDLRHQCGRLLAALGRKEAAIEQFEAALQLYPKHSRTLIALAEEAEAQGFMGDAAALYAEIIEDAPEHTQALLGMGRVLDRMGKTEDATVFLSAIPESASEHATARDLLQHVEKRRANGEIIRP